MFLPINEGEVLRRIFFALNFGHLAWLKAVGFFPILSRISYFYCNIMEVKEQGSPVVQNLEPQAAKPIVYKPRQKMKPTKHDQEDFFGKPLSSSYYWTIQQNRRYLKFLKDKGNLLKSDPIFRKKERVNMKISKYVKTRSSTQCHTHHQKMMIKYGSLEGIIVGLQPICSPKPKNSEKKSKDLNVKAIKEEQRVTDNIQWHSYECKLEPPGESDILKQENDQDYIYY